MFDLPEQTTIDDALIIECTGKSLKVKPVKGYYPTGYVTESDGRIYADMTTSNGAFTFIFSSLVTLIKFLVHHSDGNFTDLE